MNFVLLPIGILVGFVASILGIGGGLLFVPILLAIGSTPLQAIATSHLGILLGACSGSYQNWKMGELDLKVVMWLAIPALLGTEAGVQIARQIPSNWLLLGFAFYQIAAIFLLNLKKSLPKSHTPSQGSPKILLGIGLSAGFFAGLFGVGGGLIMVPFQVLLLGFQIKNAARNSYAAIILTSIWAVSRQLDNILFLEGIILGIGSVTGSFIGAKSLKRLPEQAVKISFITLLISVSFYTFVKAL